MGRYVATASLVFTLASAGLAQGCGDDGAAGDLGDATASPDVPVLCASTACMIDGVCVDGGAAAPDNPCLACDPLADPHAWTPARQGAACDDGDACTLTSACDAGVCAGTREPQCDTPLACADGVTCDDTGCAYVLRAGFCLVDGACVADGATPADAPCMRCDAATANDALQPVDGGACDDGDFCTVDDACVAGVCAGAPRVCDDGLDCTIDSCADGACVATPQTGACAIDGACYEDGDREGGLGCVGCQPEVDATAWTTMYDGAPCDDGQLCHASGTCAAGRCEAGLLTLDSEPNDDPVMQPVELVQEHNTTPFPWGTTVGNINPYDDVDSYLFTAVVGGTTSHAVKIEVLGEDATDAFDACLVVECYAGDATWSPTVTCQGLPKTLGKGVGCCRNLGYGESLVVAPDCASEFPVAVRTRATIRRGFEDPCTEYQLKHGAIK